ncbi:MAG: SPOR domain-containing protein [Treponema sp.]|jgi:hypothetical protein|nr:SPOR domain-containing protein [Treponema sp.]
MLQFFIVRILHARSSSFVFLVLFFFAPFPLAAQTPEGLESELRRLERLLNASDTAGRRENLNRLAYLRELSGDIEGAAAAWELAALAEPGVSAYRPLLRGAACFMALGEWERADAALKGILLDSRVGEIRLQAFFLAAHLEALRSGGTNTAALVSLSGEESYAEYRPQLYFSLWKFTGQESWRRKLVEAFPRSPEGRAAGSGGPGSPAVHAAPSPMWLLFAGRSGAGSPQGGSAPRDGAAGAPRDNAATVSSASRNNAGTAAPGQTVLQAGLFSREANAQALGGKLRAAGFSALIRGQTRAGGDYFAVLVTPGPDINSTIRELKAAGFDSFPVSYQ